MENALKQLGLGALTAVVMATPTTGQSLTIAPVKAGGDIKDRVRADLHYDLSTIDGSGYTFVELFNDGWFSKTIVDKPLIGSVGPRIETVNTSYGADQIGVGIQANIPLKSGWANASVVPVWREFDGGRIDDKAILGVAGGTTLPYGITVEGFGGINVATGAWDYGEGYILKQLGDRTKLGLHLDLTVQEEGTITPRASVGLEARINIIID